MYKLLAQVSVPPEVKPALSLLDNTVLGAVLIIVLVICVVAVTALIKVQNARVADQKALSDKSEALMDKMLTAFTEMKGALESLKTTLDTLKAAEQETQRVLTTQQQAFNLMAIARGNQAMEPEHPKKARG
jgi:hypothetical protein